jgi:hypothetical protein
MGGDEIFDKFIVERHVETNVSHTSKEKNRIDDAVSIIEPVDTERRLSGERLSRIKDSQDRFVKSSAKGSCLSLLTLLSFRGCYRRDTRRSLDWKRMDDNVIGAHLGP